MQCCLTCRAGERCCKCLFERACPLTGSSATCQAMVVGTEIHFLWFFVFVSIEEDSYKPPPPSPPFFSFLHSSYYAPLGNSHFSIRFRAYFMWKYFKTHAALVQSHTIERSPKLGRAPSQQTLITLLATIQNLSFVKSVPLIPTGINHVYKWAPTHKGELILTSKPTLSPLGFFPSTILFSSNILHYFWVQDQKECDSVQMHLRNVLQKEVKQLLHENFSSSHSDPTYTSSIAEASFTPLCQHLHPSGGERGCPAGGQWVSLLPEQWWGSGGTILPLTPATCSSRTAKSVSSDILLQRSCQI